ncbi:unnamed protein product, partial [Ectocarpus fasciculatus]
SRRHFPGPRTRTSIDRYPPAPTTCDTSATPSFMHERIGTTGRRDGALLDIDCVSSQLGVAFSSNDNGDGPPNINGDEQTKCLTCDALVAGKIKMCVGCYDSG